MMNWKWIRILGLSLIFYLTITHVFAQEESRYLVQRLEGTVELDGLSFEEAWESINPIPMVQHSPNFGNPPTEKTEIRIAYDEEYLYLAGRLYDREPSKILATSKKRDFLSPNSDWFGIIMDTFNDKENAMGFFTTPTGLRLDLTIFDDAQGEMPINLSWNTFWDVKTVVNDEGWFAEIRIPFSSLRFQEIDGQIVMGIIIWRWIPHKSEQLIFPAIPVKWGAWSAWKPSQAREIILRKIPSRSPLYITPYLLGGFGRSYELNEAETEYSRQDDPAFELGLDLKYGLSSNLTLDVTLNTDFAQVEADNQQVNLTRFSLFFPEKRQFFQERSSNFEFNLGELNRLFYSRRIGIYDGKPVRIYGGLRAVGRLGSWDVGLMNMQTAPIEDLESENFGVLRLRRQVINPNSYVGGIVTSRIGSRNNYNVAYGLDGIFRVFGDDYFKFHMAQTFEDSLENRTFSTNPTRIGLIWERRSIEGFAYDFSYSRSGRDFRPGIGFDMREDYTRWGGRILYGWILGEGKKLLRHYFFLNGIAFLGNEDNRVESVEAGPGWDFAMRSGDQGKISTNMYYESVPDSFSLDDDVDVPPGDYMFYGTKGYYQTVPGGLVWAIFKWDAGSFYDGWRFSLSTMPTWSISSDLELSGFYEFNRVSFPDRDQQLTAHIGRLRVMWMLSTAFSLTAFVQYNSAIDAVITNIRFRYNPREGNDLYMVYDEGYNTNRFRETPVLPSTSNRTVLLKYTYTFRL